MIMFLPPSEVFLHDTCQKDFYLTEHVIYGYVYNPQLHTVCFKVSCLECQKRAEDTGERYDPYEDIYFVDDWIDFMEYLGLHTQPDKN